MMDYNKKLSEENRRLQCVVSNVKTAFFGVLPELKKTLALEKLKRVNEIISVAKNLN